MTPSTRDAQDSGDTAVVRGERTIALGSEARSAQARLSSLLAAALMIALGVSALTWYYAHALTRVSRGRETAQTSAANRAQGEMALPSLGPIEPPRAPGAASEAGAGPQTPDATSAAAPPPTPELPLEPHPPVPGMASPPDSSGPAVRPHRAGALARRLSGVVFTRDRSRSGASVTADRPSEETLPAVAAAGERRAVDGGEGGFTALLRPTTTPATSARMLPTQRLLLPRGAFIDCTLETAIDSTLPGMTTCITAADTFGADGKVVLLERGSKLVGETRGQVQHGQARVFVVWTEARTPAGVIVPLDSPGTDELGRAGLPGEVQRHFFERFGAAVLVSLIEGAVQAGVQASARSGGTVIYTPSGSQEVLTEVLKDTIRITPTVIKHNGDRIQALVARDIDFRPVYELHASATGR